MWGELSWDELSLGRVVCNSDGRADNAAYRHDRRADKRRYRHDRKIDIQNVKCIENGYILS